MHNRLKTRDRLYRFGIVNSEECILCNNDSESAEHFFFECRLSAECLRNLKEWFNWNCKATSLHGLVKWLRKANCSRFRKAVLAAGVAATVYILWKARNELFWNDKRMDQPEMMK